MSGEASASGAGEAIIFAEHEFMVRLRDLINQALTMSAGMAINPAVPLLGAFVLNIVGEHAVKRAMTETGRLIIKLEEKTRRKSKILNLPLRPLSALCRVLFGKEVEEVPRADPKKKVEIFDTVITDDEKRRQLEKMILKLLFKPGYTSKDFRNEIKDKFGDKFGDIGSDIEVMDFLFQFRDLVFTGRMYREIEKWGETREDIKKLLGKIEEIKENIDNKFTELEGIIKGEFDRLRIEMSGFEIITSLNRRLKDRDLSSVEDTVLNFRLEHVLQGLDSPREVGREVVREISEGRSLLLVGESLSGKSVLLMQAMVEASGEFDVILRIEGSVRQPHLLKSGLERLAEGRRVLVVVDELSRSWGMVELVEGWSNENVVFLMALNSNVYRGMGQPALSSYQIPEEERPSPKSWDVFLKKIEVIGEDRLRLSDKDKEAMINKWEKLTGREIDEKVRRYIQREVRLAGEASCVLAFPEEKRVCYDTLCERIRGRIEGMVRDVGDREGFRERLLLAADLVFLEKLALGDTGIDEREMRKATGLKKGMFSRLEGVVFFRDGGCFTLHEAVALRWLILRRQTEEEDWRLGEVLRSLRRERRDEVAKALGWRAFDIAKAMPEISELLLWFAELAEPEGGEACLALGSAHAVLCEASDSKEHAVRAEKLLSSVGDEEPAELVAKAMNSLALLIKNKWHLLEFYEEIPEEVAEREAINEAYCLYSKAIEVNPKDAVAMNNLALLIEDKWHMLEFYEGIPEEAAEREAVNEAYCLYSKAIEVNPKYAKAMTNLAVLLYQKWHMLEFYEGIPKEMAEREAANEAYCLYSKAIEVNPRLAEAMNNLALLIEDKWHMLEFYEGIPEEAAEREAVNEAYCLYSKAIEVNPKYAKAMTNLAVLLYQKWHMLEFYEGIPKEMAEREAANEAYRLWSKAIEVNPRLAGAMYNLAVLIKNKWHMLEEVRGDRGRGMLWAAELLGRAWHLRRSLPDGGALVLHGAVEVLLKLAGESPVHECACLLTLSRLREDAGFDTSELHTRALEVCSALSEGERREAENMRERLFRCFGWSP